MRAVRTLDRVRALLAAAAAAVATAAVPAPAGSAAALPGLTVRQQAGQLVMAGFNGTTAPAWLLDALRRRHVGGVILFGHNVRSPAQVRSLTASLRRADPRVLVAVDQEGGVVRRLSWASPSRGQPAQSTESIAFRTARAGRRDLAAVGVNLNLAPVADVALGSGSEMRSRAFPGGAGNVSRLLRASLRGYGSGPVAPAVKHFPGFGAARVNTDDAAVTIRRTRAQMRSTELAPFRAAIAARAPVVMAAHAVYPAYDGRRIASQSHAILTGLLRRQMGFGGVVATDSLDAAAVRSRSSAATAAVRSLAAGADLMLLAGPANVAPVARALHAAARRSQSMRARVAESARRVIALKARLAR